MTHYRTIVADPPWDYGGDGPKPYQRTGRYAGGHSPLSGAGTKSVRYGAMSLDALRTLDVPAADDAHLYLWTTNAFMVEAHDIARAWGFAPKSILTWCKTHQDDPARVSMKLGYYFRGATEHVLFCVRGSLPLQTREGLPTGFLWPRTPHSVKPEAFYDLVEVASPGPRLEMFSRRARLGWDTWGDEALGHVEFGGAA
jgi:N6-adenosine-specific RNA methylase IME4